MGEKEEPWGVKGGREAKGGGRGGKVGGENQDPKVERNQIFKLNSFNRKKELSQLLSLFIPSILDERPTFLGASSLLFKMPCFSVCMLVCLSICRRDNHANFELHVAKSTSKEQRVLSFIHWFLICIHWRCSFIEHLWPCSFSSLSIRWFDQSSTMLNESENDIIFNLPSAID